MLRGSSILLLAAAATAGARFGEGKPSALRALYEAHDWAGLGRAVDANGPDLYRGAVAAAFNDARAEGLLRSATLSAPGSDEAYDAYEELSHLYLRDGRYRHLIEAMEKRWASFPGRAAEAGERATMAPFRGLPDQGRVATGAATLRHEGNMFLPVSIQGGAGRYFFDTGAWLSCLSESEARRLGLTASAAKGSVGTSTGASVGMRMALAREVVVGGTRFENVSFAVFPDDQEPWSGLPPGQRGIVGMPLLLGLQTLRWSHDGTLTIGAPAKALRVDESNLLFDDDHLVATVGFEQERVRLTLDTGAETTDLYQGFADQFPAFLSRTGRKGVQEVRGVGQAQKFESVSLPEAHFEVGGFDTVLRPAQVLMTSIGAKRSAGNLGIDLLQQAAAFRIDLLAMTLELEPKATP